MACHVAFVEVSAGLSLPEQVARSVGWRTTRLERGALAHSSLRNCPPDLVIVGRELLDLSARHFVRLLKLDPVCHALPLIQLGTGLSGAELEVEPDAWLDPSDARLLPATAAQARVASAERLRDGGRAEIRFRLPSERGQLDELLRLVGPWFASCGFGPSQVHQLVLSVRELGTNAIEWGHGNDPSRPIFITCRLDHEKMSILVRDTGPGFNPCAIPHAAHPGNPLGHLPVRAALRLRDGGFGILLTRGLVDHLCYNDVGNEARVVKFLPVRRQQPPIELFSASLAASR